MAAERVRRLHGEGDPDYIIQHTKKGAVWTSRRWNFRNIREGRDLDSNFAAFVMEKGIVQLMEGDMVRQFSALHEPVPKILEFNPKRMSEQGIDYNADGRFYDFFEELPRHKSGGS